MSMEVSAGTFLASLSQFATLRLGRLAVFVALLAWIGLTAFNTGLHLDVARDILVIQQADGYRGLPTIGPVFAVDYHLGPVWYWLVMFLYNLTGSLQGLMAGLIALVALQFPMAYQVGKAWHSRQAGWLLVALISLPSWMTLQVVFPLHSMYTAACMLAALWRFRRFLDTGRTTTLCQAAFALSLGSHAHPAIAIILPILVAGIPRLWCMGRRGAVALVWALVCYLLLFLPAALTMDRQLDELVASNVSSFRFGTIARAPELLVQAVYGGTAYVGSLLFPPGSLASNLTEALAGATSAVVLLGIVLTCLRQPVFIAWLIVAALILSLMRPVTPYYMLTPLFVLAVFTSTMGLTALPRSAQNVVIACSFAFGALFMVQWHRAQDRGDWPLAFYPMFDVTGAAQLPTPFINVRARDAEAFGNFSCHENPVLHGPAAWIFFATYEVESRWSCGRPAACLGACAGGRTGSEWLGTSQLVLSRLGVNSTRSFGALHLMPVKRVILRAALPVHQVSRYPPLVESAIIPTCGTYTIVLAPGETLAVSNLTFGATPQPRVILRGSRDFPPTTFDFSTSYWRFDSETRATMSVPCTGLTEAVVF